MVDRVRMANIARTIETTLKTCDVDFVFKDVYSYNPHLTVEPMIYVFKFVNIEGVSKLFEYNTIQ